MKSEGEKVNWDEKAKGEAIEAYFSAIPTATQTRMVHPFIEGSRWMRDQLRTDEAIERVARSVARLDPDEEWPNETIIDDEYRDECFETARAAIAALLGEKQ